MKQLAVLITRVYLAGLLAGSLGVSTRMKGAEVPLELVQLVSAAVCWTGAASCCHESLECLSGWGRPGVPMQGVAARRLHVFCNPAGFLIGW